MLSSERFRNRKPTLSEVANLYGLFRKHPRYQGCVGHWIMNENGGLVLYDISGSGYHGTFIGPPTWTTGLSGPALAFNGTDQVVTMGQVLDMGTQSFTLIAYCKSTSVAVSANNGVIYKKDVSSIPAAGYSLAMPNGQFGMRMGDGTAGVNNLVGTGFNDDRWHQVVSVARRGTNVETFLDGASRGQTSETTLGNINNAAVPFSIGGRYVTSVGQAFLGSLDHIQVYDRALSANEVVSKFVDPYLEFDWAYQRLHPRFFFFSVSMPKPALPFINTYYNNHMR